MVFCGLILSLSCICISDSGVGPDLLQQQKYMQAPHPAHTKIPITIPIAGNNWTQKLTVTAVSATLLTILVPLLILSSNPLLPVSSFGIKPATNENVFALSIMLALTFKQLRISMIATALKIIFYLSLIADFALNICNSVIDHYCVLLQPHLLLLKLNGLLFQEGDFIKVRLL